MIKFDSFESILKHISSLVWKNDIDDQTIFDIAKKYYCNLEKKFTKNKTLFRLAGQSGSGKTTQLLPSTKKYFESKNMKPMNFCVRNFAPLHPDYDTLLKNFGKSEIREKTNGFALKCMLICLVFALNDGYDIIFEVTLLSNDFEDFVNFYLNKFGYKNLYLCLAVNHEISQFFISKRQSSTLSNESSRVVYKSSSDFFYESLPTALTHLSKTSPTSRIIIWNAFDKFPKYDGDIQNCLEIFENERKKTSGKFADESELLDAKIDYLLKQC